MENSSDSSTMPGQKRLIQTLRPAPCPAAWPGSTPGATVTADGACGSSFLPIKSMTAAPNRGNSGISQMLSRKFMSAGSPFQQVHLVGQHRFLVAEQRDQEDRKSTRLNSS